jgi:hypothetical protein
MEESRGKEDLINFKKKKEMAREEMRNLQKENSNGQTYEKPLIQR